MLRALANAVATSRATPAMVVWAPATDAGRWATTCFGSRPRFGPTVRAQTKGAAGRRLGGNGVVLPARAELVARAMTVDLAPAQPEVPAVGLNEPPVLRTEVHRCDTTITGGGCPRVALDLLLGFAEYARACRFFGHNPHLSRVSGSCRVPGRPGHLPGPRPQNRGEVIIKPSEQRRCRPRVDSSRNVRLRPSARSPPGAVTPRRWSFRWGSERQ